MPRSATTKKPSLLDQAKTLPDGTRRNWIAKLKADQQSQVLELLRAYVAKTIRVTCPQIAEILKENGIAASMDDIHNAVRRVRQGEFA